MHKQHIHQKELVPGKKIFNCSAKMDDQECNLLDAQMNSSIPWDFGMSVVQERFGLFFKES